VVLTPEQDHARAVTAGRLGGLAKSARNDAREGTRAARSAFLAKFELEVDPEGVLPLRERLRRAEAARKLYMARLLLQRRQKRAAAKQAAAEEQVA
jgi:hypothetical protein